ncbi:MAG: F0F1 ATP synthase subunit A [Candidatus Stygibacter australis]|nr:F0F1 ATP synthase subunit A [Candidatus Stygibacter australis]MDP8320993.1 F0F1 ATP synthase subunit A [Candidatus Stygibacter australis]
MAKKKGNLRWVFLIFIVIEVALVLISSGFKKELEIGIDSGKLVIRNKASHYDLQDKITEDFQRDEFLIKNTRLHLYEIPDFQKFTEYLASDNPVMSKAFSVFNTGIKNHLRDSDTTWNASIKTELINELNKKVISNPKFYEAGFKGYIKEHTTETEYYLSELKKKTPGLTPLDISRLNRLVIEGIIPETILSRQEHLPRIYGSYKAYQICRSLFGETSALGAFYLIRMLLIVDIIFLLLIIFLKKSLSGKPSKGQLIMEMIYKTFEDFVSDTLGQDRLNFTPYIVTIFLFIWICNMVGLIPIPGFMEPTRNINVPLGMGIIVILVVHFTAIRVKGLWGHFEHYLNPIKNPLAALDIVSEFSKVISISFRLFGNILGGAIIIVVVSSLVSYIVLPVGLNLFFGIFVGTVQAFVFTMLALTYIGVEIAE